MISLSGVMRTTRNGLKPTHPFRVVGVHGIDLPFPADENFRKKSVCLGPRRDHLIGRSFAENLANRSEQVFAHDWIVLRQDAQRGMLLRDEFDRSAKDFQVVDIGGVCADGCGKSLLLRTRSLVSGIKQAEQLPDYA